MWVVGFAAPDIEFSELVRLGYRFLYIGLLRYSRVENFAVIVRIRITRQRFFNFVVTLLTVRCRSLKTVSETR